MEPKRSLVFIIHSPFTDKPGGRETWITNIAEGMEKYNYKTFVICEDTSKKSRYNQSSRLKFIRVRTLRAAIPNFLLWAKASLGLLLVLDMGIFAIRSYYAAKKLLSKEGSRTYFIATNTVTEGAVVYYIQKNLRHSKVVVFVRGKAPLEISQTVPYLKSLAYSVEKVVVSSVKNVWTNGYDMVGYLKDIGVQTTVVPNGVDYNTFKKAGYKKGKERRVIVMSIATLRPIKGVSRLIETIQKIRERTNADFKVVFVGAGNQKPYRKYLRKTGFGKYTEFLGAKPCTDVIGNADIVICLSGGGGMPNTTLEAMAAGKAIVAWNSPIYRQLLKNGKTALLATEGDTGKLATAITKLIEDPKLRVRIGKQAQSEAKNYDLSKVCKIFDRNLKTV